jgi:hypothetical protein
MTTNRIENENNEMNEIVRKAQPYVLLFVVVFSVLLVVVPLLPGVISNFVYAFSGEKPKIYWYLSRSAGFVALSILWVSMAMGLTITNKIAKRWPGTPAAFAVHQYVSLLGLAFAVYHALVLIGDHYTDFSLPRLLTPFSIAYERVWVGLGQVGFFVWVIVVLSFYVRKHIGQKVWRLIHYANFAMYAMGMFHGLFTGWDTEAGWAQWYYWLSGGSLLALVAYRVYQSVYKRKTPHAKPAVARPEVQRPQQSALPTSKPAQSEIDTSPTLPSAGRTPAPVPAPALVEPQKPLPTPMPVEVKMPEEVSTQPVLKEKEPEEKEKPGPVVEQTIVDPQQPSQSSVAKAPRAVSAEQSASVLRIQELFNAIRPPSPLPEKPEPEPVLRIQLDVLAERLMSASSWDKVSMEQPYIKSDPASQEVPPSRLLLRIKDNLPAKAEPYPSNSPLKIRSKRAVVQEDDGNV